MRVIPCLLILGLIGSTAAAQEPPALPSRSFSATGHTVYGDWRADARISEAHWRPDVPMTIGIAVQFSSGHLAAMAAAGIKADRLCVLVTAERTFDADGWMRLPSDERMSTLLTPTGLAIEGGVQGAVTPRFGYPFRTPVDELAFLPVADVVTASTGTNFASFSMTARLPGDLPPGLYRLRFDIGVMVGTRYYNFNGFSFAQRPSTDQAGTSTYFYSHPFPASGPDASGRTIDARQIRPRIPWLLLSSYNSNGYRGVVADEDRHRFATSDRSLIPDEVVLPMYSDGGTRLTYSLEPQFPADTIDPLQNITWDWTQGELTIQVTGPDGKTVNLGTLPVAGKSGSGPTTKNAAFTAWKPETYGRYVVVTRGWVADARGRRYEGGGTYRFWIAKRMTLATATFQGMAYPVGSSYGRDIQFNPALPADVQVTATLYVHSNPQDTRSVSYSGKASPAGLFGAAQGMKSFPLNAPGEYHAQVLATHTDGEGHLWVSVMRHAGVVYEEDSPVIARGKMVAAGGKYLERGHTQFEGYVEPDGTQHLAHLTFPYAAGDMLLIAADGQGANKIEPVLTYQNRGDTSPWDTKLNGVGTTNLRVTTSNGYSPHLFPEYITAREYYYAAAPRPGFMGRFLVGESTVRAPYWSVTPNAFGSQIAASPNGDAPGDIYRLIGGIVIRRPGQAPMYSGYIASAFLLPRKSNNNRVVAAGSEDLTDSTGKKGRFFLVGLRPGSAFEVGSVFRPALQIDPLVPAAIRFVLTYPDGRTQTAVGTADRFGSFAGSTAWPLDVAGLYRYQVIGTWNGFEGRMPGLPDEGGEFYVYSRTRPPGAAGLRLDGATHLTFSAGGALAVSGSSTAASVRYALITPGAVIEQGELPVSGGKFQYRFDPAAVHAKVPIYDIVSITTGKPQIGRAVHLTFFSRETAAGTAYFDFARVILRGTTVLLPRSGVPAAATATAPDDPGTPLLPEVPRPAVRIIAETEVNGIRSWDATLGAMARAGDLRTVRREADTMIRDVLHERLQQYYMGVPVFGADVTRQVVGGVTVSVFGSVHPDIALDVRPAFGADDARWLIEQAVSGTIEGERSITLVVFPTEGGGYTLAWHANATTSSGEESCLVDARSGQLLLRYPVSTSGLVRKGESGALDEAFGRLMAAATAGAELAGVPRAENERAIRALFRTFRYLLPSTATFEHARAASLQSAHDLFGNDRRMGSTMLAAWIALQVPVGAK